MDKRAVELILVAATAFMSVSAILVRFSEAPSMVLVFYRMLFTALLMSPFILWRYRLEIRSISRPDMMMCIASGVILALHFFTYFESLRYTSITSNLVLVNTSAFFVAIISLIVFKERMPFKGWLAILITFIGSFIISMSDLSFGGDNALYGDFLAILGALFFSFYAVIGRKERRDISVMTYTFIIYSVATLTSLVLLLISGEQMVGYEGKDYLCALGMAVFCTLLGHTVYNWGFKYVTASFVSVVALSEPIFGTILGILFFGEVPTMYIFIGSIVTLFGMYLFAMIENRSENDKEGA